MNSIIPHYCSSQHYNFKVVCTNIATLNLTGKHLAYYHETLFMHHLPLTGMTLERLSLLDVAE